MKTLYLKILELLATIPEIRHIDLQYGQLQEEQPPLAFPAVLISMSQTSENIDDLYQIHSAQFSLQLSCKLAGETNSLAPDERRAQALAYLDLSGKIYKKLQGYEDETFEAFSQTAAVEPLLRKGLKTVEMRFATSWREDLYIEALSTGPMARYTQLDLEFLPEGNLHRPTVYYFDYSQVAHPNQTVWGYQPGGKQETYAKLPDEYYLLPLVQDGRRNPHAYNATKGWLSCVYEQNTEYANSFLRHAVRKTSAAGAAECVAVFRDPAMINYNLYKLRGWFEQGFMQRVVSIVIIVDGVPTYYTRQDVLRAQT